MPSYGFAASMDDPFPHDVGVQLGVLLAEGHFRTDVGAPLTPSGAS